MQLSNDLRPQLNISVRELVEFIYKSGDIDDRIGGGVSTAAMEAGSAFHKKIQKAGGNLYHAEVPLAFCVSYDEYDVAIDGRADGIIYDLDDNLEPMDITIDEIKGMYANVMDFTEPKEVHLAQALVYAYIVATDYDKADINVRITYGNLDNNDVNYFERSYTREDLDEFFIGLMDSFRPWSDYIYSHRKERDESTTDLEFPFEYREGQRKLVRDVYKVISSEELLFINAPTGTGKTIATCYPSVMALGQKKAQRIFYLTAKTATSKVARDTFSILNKAGYKGKTLQITAKDKACILEKRSCNPVDCPAAKGHWDRVGDAIYDIITHETMIDRECILEYATKHNVCPFEFSLDVSYFVDHIICDYNYVFDPNVYLQRFFAAGRRADSIVLIDEAHNMVERAREMYSVTLIKEEILQVKGIVKNTDKKLATYLEKINKIMLAMKRACTGDRLDILDGDELSFAVLNAYGRFMQLFAKRINFGEEHDKCVDLYFKLRDYSNILEDFDFEHYRIYGEFVEGDFLVHIACMDPSDQLQRRIDKTVSTIYFSATLLPINYYKELLCTKEQPYAIYANSIFDVNKRLLLVANDVTSKYTRRGFEEYDRFARYISSIVNERSGNYMVFCPSYAFIDNVVNAFSGYECNGDILVQRPNMNEEQREEFLQAFEEVKDSQDGTLEETGRQKARSLIGFCTLGGIFSEGIDLRNDTLIGVIIAGAGLPQVGNERTVMSEFFEATKGDGFNFAYLYPGMNKVIQAAGRLIRTEEDVGVIALLDERFNYTTYSRTFPREWANRVVTSVQDADKKVKEFWKKINKKVLGDTPSL